MPSQTDIERMAASPDELEALMRGLPPELLSVALERGFERVAKVGVRVDVVRALSSVDAAVATMRALPDAARKALWKALLESAADSATGDDD